MTQTVMTQILQLIPMLETLQTELIKTATVLIHVWCQ